jgi:membrane protein
MTSPTSPTGRDHGPHAPARENRVERPAPVPDPAVIRSEVVVRNGPGAGAIAGLLGVGVITGLLGARLLGQRP